MAKRAHVYVDKGEPGKYYFEAPITHNLSFGEKKKTPEPYTDPRKEPVNLVNYRDRTNCRLISSKNAMNSRVPKEVQYLLTPHPSLQEVQDYLDLKRVEGFGEGAIVCRKWAAKGHHKWSQQWGTIMLVHKIPRGMMAPYHPYSVKWHMIGEIEQAWAEDLIVIHAALDDDTLDAIAEAQGVEV